MVRGPHLKKAENGFYYIRWVDGARSKRQSTRCRELHLAEEWLDGWYERRAATLGPGQGRPAARVETAQPTASPEKAPLTIGALWALYRDRHVIPKLPLRSSVAQSWRQLEPFFGKIVLAELTEADVDRYVAHRRQPRTARVGHGMRQLAGAKDSTIRQDLIALSACLNWCADKARRPRIIAPEDVPFFDRPLPGLPRSRWLSLAEVQRLLDAARDLRLTPPSSNPTAFRRDPARLSRTERFLWLGLETGARMTAICELTWDRVDFGTGMVDFNVPGRPLTSKRRTAVPMSSSLRRMLEQAHRERTSDHVLDNASSTWATVKEVARLAEVENVSPHVLRHTAATQMARRGVPLWVIANVLGNTLGQVERVYAKHCPQAMGEAVELISMGKLRTDDMPKVRRVRKVARAPRVVKWQGPRAR